MQQVLDNFGMRFVILDRMERLFKHGYAQDVVKSITDPLELANFVYLVPKHRGKISGMHVREMRSMLCMAVLPSAN